MSFERPTRVRYPSASRWPTSPVCSQPSRVPDRMTGTFQSLRVPAPRPLPERRPMSCTLEQRLGLGLPGHGDDSHARRPPRPRRGRTPHGHREEPLRAHRPLPRIGSLLPLYLLANGTRLAAVSPMAPAGREKTPAAPASRRRAGWYDTRASCHGRKTPDPPACLADDKERVVSTTPQSSTIKGKLHTSCTRTWSSR